MRNVRNINNTRNRRNRQVKSITITRGITTFHKRIAILVCVLIAVLALIMLFNVTSSAKNTYNYDISYTNVHINNGDTLWDIAKSNYSVEYGDFDDYIEEIRTLNHISGDMIHVGGYLVIPTIR